MQILSRLLVMLMVTGALCDGLSYIYTQLNSLQTQVQQLLARQPQVIRIPPIDLSEPITLHQQTKSLALNVTLPPNKRVYGLLVQIYYSHTSSNSVAPGSHGYLSTKLKQRDDPLNIVQTSSQHFNWYANTATELEIISWSKDRPSVLEAYLYDTYNTQSPGNPYGKNYYLIRLVGYLAY